jgi:FKBP-type peptidyl-prolyl cis-trans isomerase FklB
MRVKYMTLAVALLGVALLGGCSEQKPAAASYDLTPESNQKFLADNAAQKGVITTPSGLQYRVLTTGHGAKVTSPADVVTVTYRGWTIDGHVFDQTQSGQTASFPVGGLIRGWVEALGLMREGDEWQLVIPSELGYGAQGAGADIGPNQTLVFKMKLIAVKPAAP